MDLLLFEKSPHRVRAAVRAGLRDFVCDWESRGKALRQEGQALEENADTPDDVRSVRALTPGRVVCRINAVWEETARELDLAAGAGATDVLLPMVRGPAEVEHALRLLDGRCGLGILVETREAVQAARELAALPLSLVYVGLNDLRLARGTGLFAPLADGTLDGLREAFAGKTFGFGGLTTLDGGAPLPGRHLLAEMARLACDYAFLRRSFRRDTEGRDLAVEVARLHAAYSRLRTRGPDEVARDREALLAALGQL